MSVDKLVFNLTDEGSNGYENDSQATYLGLGEEDDYVVYCFPTRGKSKRIKDEVSCICEPCPVYEEMKFATEFFCTRGTEEQQKES